MELLGDLPAGLPLLGPDALQLVARQAGNAAPREQLRHLVGTGGLEAEWGGSINVHLNTAAFWRFFLFSFLLFFTSLCRCLFYSSFTPSFLSSAPRCCCSFSFAFRRNQIQGCAEYVRVRAFALTVGKLRFLLSSSGLRIGSYPSGWPGSR